MKKSFVALLAVLLIVSMTFVLSSCDISDEEIVNTTETVEHTQGKTELKKSNEEILAYFNTLVNSVKVKTPAVSYKQELKIDDKSLKITKPGGEEDKSLKSFNDALPGLKSLILTDIQKKSGSVAYGTENNEVFFVKGESWSSALTTEDISSAVMNEVGDKYYITITFDDISEDSRATLAKAFELRDKATLLTSPELAKIAEYLEIKDYNANYTGCAISATVDRLTDTLESVTYSKTSDVTASAKGLKTFEKYGDIEIGLILKDTTSFSFVWEENRETSPLDTTAA